MLRRAARRFQRASSSSLYHISISKRATRTSRLRTGARCTSLSGERAGRTMNGQEQQCLQPASGTRANHFISLSTLCASPHAVTGTFTHPSAPRCVHTSQPNSLSFSLAQRMGQHSLHTPHTAPLCLTHCTSHLPAHCLCLLPAHLPHLLRTAAAGGGVTR